MLNNFKLLLIIVIIAGLSAGAAFGAGAVYSRTLGTTPATTSSPVANGPSATNPGQTASNSITGATGADGLPRGGVRGSIEGVEGDIVSVKGSDGNTIKVKLDGKTAIRKTIDGGKEDLQAGMTVLVVGDRGADGTVSASQISLVPAGSSLPAGVPAAGGTSATRTTPAAGTTPSDPARGRRGDGTTPAAGGQR